MQIEYVAGFLFDENLLTVALIEKQRPAWQKGKFNAIGGKIEPNESPEDAMRREFQEETGFDIPEWKRFCVLRGQTDVTWRVHFFYAIGNVREVRKMTDEDLIVVRIKHIGTYQLQTIPNLLWLIPMALNAAQNLESCSEFQITEA